MRGGRAWFWFGLVLCAAALTVHAQQVPEGGHASLPESGRVLGLGVNIHFTDARAGEMAMLAAGGFRWVRMDFVWEATERERGRYDFAAYDRLLDALALHGLRALWILDYSNRLYEADRSVATEAGREAFARWAAAAAAHFRGRGVVWEIWNEPNIPNFWKPAPQVADYVALAARATAAIRDVAPGEAVIGPATSEIDLEFLEGCFRAGLLEGWDAVSVHPYRQSDPESVVAEYARLRRLIDRYAPPGKAIPILSGEWGYSAAWRGFDAGRQGRLLPRQWLINMAEGIPLSIWYDWHDDGRDPEEAEHHFGTVENTYHEGRDPVYDPKPAYHAARTLAGILEGCRYAKRVAGGGPDDYVLLFVGDENGDRLAAWTAAASPRPVSIPSADGTYAVVSHTGDPLPSLAAAEGVLTIRLTGEPVYLRSDQPNPVWREAPAVPALDRTAEGG